MELRTVMTVDVFGWYYLLLRAVFMRIFNNFQV